MTSVGIEHAIPVELRYVNRHLEGKECMFPYRYVKHWARAISIFQKKTKCVFKKTTEEDTLLR